MLRFFYILKGIKKDGQIDYFFTAKPVHLDQSEEIFFSLFPIFHSAISWWNGNGALLCKSSRLCTRALDSSWSLLTTVVHIMMNRNRGVRSRKGRSSFANSRDHNISSPTWLWLISSCPNPLWLGPGSNGATWKNSCLWAEGQDETLSLILPVSPSWIKCNN